MIGILRKIEEKEFQTEDGKKFKKTELTFDVIVDEKNNVKTYKGSFTPDYLNKYLNYCGFEIKYLIGKRLYVNLQKRLFKGNNDEDIVINYVRSFKVLGEDGKPIIMPFEN